MERHGLSTGATAVLMIALAVVLVGCGILLGALVIADDEADSANSAAEQAITEGGAQQRIQKADQAAVATAAVSDAAVKAAEADNDATVKSASAWLAYLQGVAELNRASQQIALAAEQKSKQQKVKRLLRAQVLARAAAVGARANQGIRNAQAKARLRALSKRATVVQGAAQGVQQKLSNAAGRAQQAAQRQLDRLNAQLQRGAARLEQQLQGALAAAAAGELERAIEEIERQLEIPIQLPQG